MCNFDSIYFNDLLEQEIPNFDQFMRSESSVAVYERYGYFTNLRHFLQEKAAPHLIQNCYEQGFHSAVSSLFYTLEIFLDDARSMRGSYGVTTGDFDAVAESVFHNDIRPNPGPFELNYLFPIFKKWLRRCYIGHIEFKILAGEFAAINFGCGPGGNGELLQSIPAGKRKDLFTQIIFGHKARFSSAAAFLKNTRIWLPIKPFEAHPIKPFRFRFSENTMVQDALWQYRNMTQYFNHEINILEEPYYECMTD